MQLLDIGLDLGNPIVVEQDQAEDEGPGRGPQETGGGGDRRGGNEVFFFLFFSLIAS